jgi:hypothetical protein
MAAQSGSGAPLRALWLSRRPHLRRDRHHRTIGPIVEALEGRRLLAGTSPIHLVPVHEPTGTPTPQQLGAAYQQVVAIQTTTLQSLGDSYREVQAAGTQLASRTAVAIQRLNAELGQVKSRHQAYAITASIRRDRHILNQGGAAVTRTEQGLDISHGLADNQTNTDKIYIPNSLFTTLKELVREDRSTGTAISRSGQRSANALVGKLDELGDQLIVTTTTAAAR